MTQKMINKGLNNMITENTIEVEIETKHFGTMNIKETEILKFPQGILAFESFTNFTILPENGDSVFHWLQSLDDPKLSFLLLEPYSLMPDYVPDIFAYEVENLFGSRDISHLSVWCIVTIPPNQPEKMTINAQGPIVVSKEKRLGGQFISNNESHLVRTPVLELVEAGVMA
jgi:flagellar assembly factor FliW